MAKYELELYLEENKLTCVKNYDVLGYWKENKSRFPMLFQMARDILAIPYLLLHLNLHSVLGESA